MQRHINFGAFNYIFLIILLKLAAYNCNLSNYRSSQARLASDLLAAAPLSTNLVMSPTSLQNSLLVGLLGSKTGSQTLNELQRASRTTGSKNSLAKGLKNAGSERLNNFFLINKKIRLGKIFKNLTRIHTLAVKFSDRDRDRANAVEYINRYIRTRMINPINNVTKRLKIDSDTTVVAVNIINFARKWKTPMMPQDFSVNGTLHLIHKSAKYLYGNIKELNARAAVLPLSQSSASLLVLYPNDNSLYLRERLQSVDVTKIQSTLKYSLVDLYLPRFRIVSRPLSIDLLRTLNVTEALSGRAQFDDMFANNIKSFLRFFEERTVIEVDKKGISFTTLALSQYELTSHFSRGKSLEKRPANSQAHADVEVHANVEDLLVNRPFFYYIIDGNKVLASGFFRPLRRLTKP